MSTHSFACNSNHESGGLPIEAVAALVLMPLVFFILMPDTRLRVIAVSVITSGAALSIAGVLVDFSQTLVLIIVYLSACAIIVFETQRQRLSLFMVADRLHSSLVEIERREQETHAAELRHMVSASPVFSMLR